MNSKILRVTDPFRGEILSELPLLDADAARALVLRSAKAQRAWARSPLETRMALCSSAMRALEEREESVARELSRQMGKPVAQARKEVRTCVARARRMIELAPEALRPIEPEAGPGQRLRITREPVGVVLDIAAWNYPLLIAINVVVPAVLSGDSVLIKHSSRTPLCAEQIVDAFRAAGAPPDLALALHCNHRVVDEILAMDEIAYVSFTGSVQGGHEIYQSAARRFIDVGLELGGKDPAYVAPDCDLERTIDGVADGAFYNAGQSCCGVERIYVHRDVHDRFVEGLVERALAYRLGDPLEDGTTLGPLADPLAGAFLMEQVAQACALGARQLCGGSISIGSCERFVAPVVVDRADHRMALMRQESFGPVVGVQAVDSDEEAITLMNDSCYGLTASIWTRDLDRALRMGAAVEAGTIFLNRCDFLDPSLAWTGVKDSGKGVSLSSLGFYPLTRPKSWNLSLPPSSEPS